MKLKFSQIYEGWRNKLIPPADMKEAIEAKREERLKICSECEHHSENKKATGWKTVRIDEHCTSCGCTLSAKTSCLSCSCPKKKWLSVIGGEDEDELNEKIDG
jgi:hypothetical protein